MKKLIKHYTRPESKYARYKAHVYSKLAVKGIIKNVNIENLKTYFLVSTGRTGTRFLAKLLDEFESNYARHEPQPNLLTEGNDYARGLIDDKTLQHVYLSARQLYFKKIAQDKRVVNYIESNNRLYSFISVLRELLPLAKFVHIARDGRDVVRSCMSRNFYTAEDNAYRISADLIHEDPYFEEWHSMDQFEKVCWWWQKKDSMILNSTNSFEDSLFVKYEDIFDEKNNYPGLYKIFSFLDLDTVNEDYLRERTTKVNATKKFTFPHWKEWDDDLFKKFNRIAGDHMKALGYNL